MRAATVDRRVRRTRELLRAALLSLVAEKGYDRITVQDLLDRADVGRSTFYAHYRDKEDLLLSGFEDIRSELTAERQAADDVAEQQRSFLQPMLTVFRHVEAHRQFWRPLTRNGGADVVARILREHVAELVGEHFRAQFPGGRGDSMQLAVAVEFVTGACMGVLIWWLESDSDASAEQMHAVFRRLAVQGVKRALVAG